MISLKEKMENPSVEKYREILKRKRVSLILKRVFDIVVSAIALLILLPACAVIAILIKLDSNGKIIYKQKRVTTNGRVFSIYKFRTMVENADKIGGLLTVGNENRITRVGRVLRKFRLDEFPQLVNILKGDMSFVGTRPEVLKYVEQYTDEMYATLLLPAGVTSLASIYYKDEAELLNSAKDADEVYINQILPEKMYYNLKAIEEFNFINEIKIMAMTVFAVLGVKYRDKYESGINKEMNL